MFRLTMFVRPSAATLTLECRNAFHHSSPTRASLIKIDEIQLDSGRRRIVRLSLNHPAKRNALGVEMLHELTKAVEEVDAQDSTGAQVLVLDSTSAGIFSSGHNLKEFVYADGDGGGDVTSRQASAQHHKRVFDMSSALCMRLQTMRCATIAQVSGLAAAAGYQLAASCDLLVASTRASFSTPGIRFGLFCSTPGVALIRNTSSKLAMRMLLTGEAVNARQAYQHGLVSELVDVDALGEEKQAVEALTRRVDELASVILKHSGPVVDIGKQCFYKQMREHSLSGAYAVATEAMVDNLKYVDAQVGLKAFVGKSKPVWTDQYAKVTDEK